MESSIHRTALREVSSSRVLRFRVLKPDEIEAALVIGHDRA